MRLKTTLFAALLTLATITATAPAAAQTTAQTTDNAKTDNFKKAQAAYQKGDTKAALKHLNAEIKQHPANAAAYFSKASILERTEGKGGKNVIKCYSAALSAPAIGPKDYSIALGMYTEALLSRGDTAEADAQIAKAMAERPSSAVMAVRGSHLMRLGQYSDALTALRSAVETAKTDSVADEGLTRGHILTCLSRLNMTDQFNAEMSTLHNMSPDDVAWRETAFDYLMQTGRRGEAADLMMQIAALGSTDSNIGRASQCAPEIVSRAEAMPATDAQAKVNALTLAALASIPGSPTESIRLCRQYGLSGMLGFNLMSQIYYRAYANRQALRLLSDEARMAKADRNDAAYLQACSQMALCQARLGDMDGVQETLKTTAALSYNEMANSVYALILCNYTNRHAEAITYADKAIDIWRASDARLVRMLGHYRIGHKAKARLEADRIIDADAKAKKIKEESKGNGAKASADGFRYGFSYLPLAYAIKGDTAFVNRTAEQQAANPWATQATEHIILAQAYGILGQTDKALACVRTALGCGFRDFRYLEACPELADIREMAEYKALAEDFKAKYAAELKSYGE